MRKSTVILLAVLLFVLSFSGCSGDWWQYRNLSEEDEKIRKISDQAIKEKFNIKDLSSYNIEINKEADGSIYVSYELFIQDYKTNESYQVEISEDGTVDKVHGKYGKYAVYLPKATKKAVMTAEKKLIEQAKEYGDGGTPFFLGIDSEGYLYLCVEYIVEIDPSTRDENGNPIGCEDHTHVILKERICAEK